MANLTGPELKAVRLLRAAENELLLIIIEDEDVRACSDVLDVIESLQRIILKIESPLRQ
jgi:hypothetical protein